MYEYLFKSYKYWGPPRPRNANFGENGDIFRCTNGHLLKGHYKYVPKIIYFYVRVFVQKLTVLSLPPMPILGKTVLFSDAPTTTFLQV